MILVNINRLLFERTTTTEKVLVAILSIFNLISAAYSVHVKNLLYFLSSLASLALVFLPYLVEHFLSCRISMDLKLAYWFLAIGGPVLGNVYRLYHYIRPWDKLLHMLSGFLVAAVGYALPDLFFKIPPGKAFKCLFAVSLSVAVGGIWEIYEFILDVLFQMDMQNDTVIDGLSSYLLGAEKGTIGTLENIQSVTVNGEPLHTGYIDIGLIDTMKDLIQCLIGSVACAIASIFQKSNSDFLSIRAV